MRFFALVIALAACGSAPVHPSSPSRLANPARDLSTAAPPPQHNAATALPARDPRVIDLDIIRITARTTAPGAEPQLTSIASADLFKQANQAAKGGRLREAASLYLQLLADFPDSQFAAVSLFNLAAVYDKQGDLAATLTALEDLVAKYPEARESIEGHLYIAALHADHQRWRDALAVLDAVLARPQLTYTDRVEALARKGYVALELGAKDQADAALEAAIAEWRRAPRIDDPYYIAMAHYYAGELLHRRFLEAPVRRGDDDMVADLDAKRVLAARAYDRWRESLAFKHAYWATAAGYQMSQIFVELWEAHVKAPYPERVAVAARATYVAEVHHRVRADLEKALEGHRMNVELARAYGVETSWSEGSARQVAVTLTLLANDNAGRYITPP